MKINSATNSSLIALGVGVLQYFLLLYSFMLLLTYVNPFGLLVGLGLRGSALYFVSRVFDLIWAVLFSIPAAINLLKLSPKKNLAIFAFCSDTRVCLAQLWFGGKPNV